jgi:hypothetical protein
MPTCRLLPVLVALLACLAVPVASAQADVYASATGTGSAPCNEAAAANRCSLDTALGAAATNETIFLAPGTYTRGSTLTVAKQVTISGEVGKARPVIEAPTGVGAVGIAATGSRVTLRDLQVKSTATIATAISLTGENDLLERVESIGKASVACLLKGKFAKAEDSLCESKGNVGLRAEYSSSGAIESVPMTATNVTSVGGEVGVSIVGVGKGGVTLYAKNAIASGGTYDVLASTSGEFPGAYGQFEHSNFETTRTQGEETSITSNASAGNQSAEPLFVDAAAGNYRELLESPTRFAGTGGGGALDLDRMPRTTTCAGTTGTDIGAYQLQECPPEPPPSGGGGENGGETGGGGSGGGNGGTGSGGTGGSTGGGAAGGFSTGPTPTPPATTATAPALSKLALTPRKFAVAGKGKKGTTISFALDRPAAVTLEVLAKKTAKGKKPRPVKVGTIAANGVVGANRVKFTGKLKGRPLAPGAYTLRATATAAGLTSAPLSASFQVTAPAS